jgi:hypothetical protein
MKVQVAPPEHHGWFVSRTGYAIALDFKAIEAVDSDGVVRAMVGWDHLTPSAAQIHFALDYPTAGRHLIRPAFEIPFTQGARQLLFGVVADSGGRQLSVALGLGFRETHRIVDGWRPGEDLVIVEMKRSECRWIQ